jgi:hypothetical protein
MISETRAAAKQERHPKRHQQAENRLRGLFEDLVMDRGETGIVSFCHHAGIPLTWSGEAVSRAWWAAFLGNYVTPDGRLDETRVAFDLSTWKPIVARVRELQQHG